MDRMLTPAETQTLYQVSAALNACDEAGPAFEASVPPVAALLGLSTAWVWLLDAGSQSWYCAYALNLPPYLAEPVHMTGQPCWCIESFLQGTLKCANVACSRLRQARLEGRSQHALNLEKHASVPLSCHGRALGILNVATPQGRALGESELRLLEMVGLHLGTTLDRIRLSLDAARLARAEERNRLARDLHDTLTQNLTAVTLQLETALRRSQASPEVDRALQIARASLDEARGALLDLRAPELRGRTLEEALAELAHQFSSRSGVRLHLRTRGSAPARVPEALLLELYRIAQEALHNLDRHSGASEGWLELAWKPAAVELSCWDEGRAASPEARPGLGLTGMRERVSAWGGRLRLTRRKGTRLAVSIPL